MGKKRIRTVFISCTVVLGTTWNFVATADRGGHGVPRTREPSPVTVMPTAEPESALPVVEGPVAGDSKENTVPTREQNCQAARMLAHVRTWDEFEKAIRQLPQVFARERPAMKTVFWNEFRQEFVAFNGAEGAFQLLRGHLLELPGLVKSISLRDAQAQSLVRKVCSQAVLQDAAASMIAGLDPERMQTPDTEEYQWTSQIIYAMHSVKGMKSVLENIQNPEYAPWKVVLEAALFRDGAMVDPAATARYFIDQYSPSSVEVLRRDARTVFRDWSQTDPEAASTAIDQMPAGSKKDAAIAAMVRAIQNTDQAGAQAWLDQISDADLRRELSVASEASGKDQTGGPK